MLRVLVTGFCTYPGPHRAAVQLRHVLRALSPDHAVDVLVVRDVDQAYVERQGTARILRVPVPAEVSPRDQIEAYRRALRRQLDGADYDVVHFRDGAGGVPVLELRERLHYAAIFDAARGGAPWAPVPAVVSTGAASPSSAAAAQAAASADEDHCLQAADQVLVPMDATRRLAAARGRTARVRVAPPGVDVDLFDWGEAPAADQPPRIVYAGALEPGRGIRVLLRAMVDIVQASDAVLSLAGPIAPGFAALLRRGIAELGLDGRVELAGVIDHDRMPAYLAAATVCVAPAASELALRVTTMYPTKLLEYLACRRAVVAPSRGTVTALLRHNVEALLFSPGDPVDLTRKLARLLAEPPLRQRLADAGYDLVRREHTASGGRRALRAAYAALVAESPWRERFAERAGAAELRASDDSERFATGLGDGEDDDATELADVEAEADVTGEAALVELSDVPDEGSERSDDAWVVAGFASERRPWAEPRDDDGTPLDLMAPAPPASSPRPLDSGASGFVAGEIDAPTPAPEALERDAGFTALGSLLGTSTEIK